jgi:hypothetical protein
MKRQKIAVAGLVALALLVSARTGSGQVVELRPNLVAIAPSEFFIQTLNGVVSLRFDGTSWNNGLGPMEIEAGTISSNGRDVSQNVYYSDGSHQSYPAGTYEYHPDHGHFHFENYALYTLKQVGAPGDSAKESSKTSFCLMDTNKINGSLPGSPANPVYDVCDAGVQGISVGWADKYGASLPGQSFEITDSPDGDYDLTVIIDPENRFLETNESDNFTCVRLRLGTISLGRTVQNLGACSGVGSIGIESINPNQVSQGGSVNVTILGNGFTEGIAVGFENGSGPAPVASNIVVVDESTITARVSVKRGGGKGTRVWDLRVGSAVLPQSFTVGK